MIEALHHDGLPGEATSVAVFLDEATEPLATFRPPASVHIDTTKLDDGEHVLRFEACGVAGVIGIRRVPFVVRNGPFITVSGLRENEAVGGTLDLRVNAFSSGETFDPVQAESRRPAPNAVWVALSVFVVWALWYSLGNFFAPAGYAAGETFTSKTVAAAAAPAGDGAAPKSSGKTVAGFDFGATGGAVFAANCAGCHGAEGAGVPGAFPALAGDPTVNAKDPTEQIKTVLHGLHGKTIHGTAFASQMPPYAQLSDSDIAAVIDHERTSWGNTGPTITPDQVKALR